MAKISFELPENFNNNEEYVMIRKKDLLAVQQGCHDIMGAAILWKTNFDQYGDDKKPRRLYFGMMAIDNALWGLTNNFGDIEEDIDGLRVRLDIMRME
jgi:hypothetical protein